MTTPLTPAPPVPYSTLARRWLADVLLADPVLAAAGVSNVVERRATKADAYPLVLVTRDSEFIGVARDVEGVPQMASGTVRIRVIDRTDQMEGVAVAGGRIQQLLQKRNDEPIDGGGLLLTCRFLREHESQGEEDGVTYSSLGGVFRLEIEAPPQV